MSLRNHHTVGHGWKSSFDCFQFGTSPPKNEVLPANLISYRFTIDANFRGLLDYRPGHNTGQFPPHADNS